MKDFIIISHLELGIYLRLIFVHRIAGILVDEFVLFCFFVYNAYVYRPLYLNIGIFISSNL